MFFILHVGIGVLLNVPIYSDAQIFSSCADAQMTSSVDGDYTIMVTSAGGMFEYEVYCYMMGPNVIDTGAPYTYINVPTSTLGSNQAQWVHGNKVVTSIFHKVRFDPTMMRIMVGDSKYHVLASESIGTFT